MTTQQPLILAVPKGRILEDVGPLMARVGIEPEQEFFDANSRRLQFTTNRSGLEIIRIRSFDTATFLAFGAAHLAICGSDVLMEFDHSEIYSPVDLRVGRCRLSVAEPEELAVREDPMQWSHLRIATKYPNITKQYFAARGVQAECIKLNGAMELAPNMGLCRRIVDLVDTGNTLKANELIEIEEIMKVSTRLAINKGAYKTNLNDMKKIIDKFDAYLNEKK